MPRVSWSKLAAGSEPLLGYRLIEPLGRGGFGEVWKCEAPGGLFKAIKIVPPGDGTSCPASQEKAALDRMKLLRHPFLLSLERVEEIEGNLVIIMELADRSLHALHLEYRDNGLPGLPRDEVLAYLVEVAEALDWMNFEHGLQHLDVKPHNLFLVSGHVKVADFGLVKNLIGNSQDEAVTRKGGVTPLYSAPEMLRGSLSRHCDQYSLAVVFQQLLTGTVPFWHENVYELMMQHLSAPPDLTALPEEDRPIVNRALAKMPEQRFPSCMDFVCTLLGTRRMGLRRSGQWRSMLTGSLEDRPGNSGKSRGEELAQRNETPEKQETSPSIQELGSGLTKSTGATSDQLAVSLNQFRTNQDRLSETPTRRIRALTPAQLAASEVARQELQANPPVNQQVPNETLSAKVTSTPLVNKIEEEKSILVTENTQKELSCDSPVPPSRTGHVKGFPGPTAVSLPGFRFHTCINQSQLGDLWSADDTQGRRCRALCLLGFVNYDSRLIDHLKALRDPALPPTEVHWSPAERLVILTSEYEGTLRDRFEQRQSEGQSGIPRAELLKLLRTAATTLDILYARYGLQHLGIHPRNLLLEEDKIWIAEFGIIPLVWLPTGQSAAVINARYSAPEVFERRPTKSADQYSLATIYVEMLTGVHPKPVRHSSESNRRAQSGNRKASGTSQSEKLQLDLLPAHDREIVSRAMSPDPENRFPHCLAFIEALEHVVQETTEQVNTFNDLPLVIPYATLMGEPVNTDVILPLMSQLVSSLVMQDNHRLLTGPQNMRYVILPDGTWEYRCPVQLYPGAMDLKIEGLRSHWRAKIINKTGDSYKMLIDVPIPRSFWERCLSQPRRIEVSFDVEPITGTHNRLTEVCVRVRYQESNREQVERILATMAPQLFDSVRLYMQAAPEQRMRERWPTNLPVRIYPVLPDLNLGETIEGTCRNISIGGIGLRTPTMPDSDHVYLHMYTTPQTLGYATLASIIRKTQTTDGWDLGAMFPDPPHHGQFE